MTDFWQKWYLSMCIILVAFGALIIGGASEATEMPIKLFFFLVSGGQSGIEFEPALRFALAIMGAVCIGWGITLIGAFKAAEHLTGEPARIAWRWITASIVTWFVIDCSLSAYTGFAFNIIPNSVLFVGVLIPIFSSGLLSEAEPA